VCVCVREREREREKLNCPLIPFEKQSTFSTWPTHVYFIRTKTSGFTNFGINQAGFYWKIIVLLGK
jgi:hypothetical protein